METYAKILENGNLQYFIPHHGGLLLDDLLIINATEALYNLAGWYKVQEVMLDGIDYINNNILYHFTGYENALEAAKDKKIQDIITYDTSEDVNIFFLGEIPMWIPRETRVSLQNSTAILLKNNINTVTLWEGIMHVELPCELLLSMLDDLEIYALQCFNKTAEHKANIMQMTSIKDIEDYDYTQGYPEKLTFIIP